VTTRSASVRAPRRSARRRAAVRRRRLVLLGGLITVGVLLYALASGLFGHAVREIELPLHHEDIIRQQSAEKDLDPSLVAGMIYVESRFSDRTSSAGAKGLMQIMPETAQFIADRSGGTSFSQGDK
jgi:soluble lytic murein transglycosylase